MYQCLFQFVGFLLFLGGPLIYHCSIYETCQALEEPSPPAFKQLDSPTKQCHQAFVHSPEW